MAGLCEGGNEAPGFLKSQSPSSRKRRDLFLGMKIPPPVTEHKKVEKVQPKIDTHIGLPCCIYRVIHEDLPSLAELISVT
ncbi:hypothetical protein ANN_23065 [Periplaneta americana]|uniref:Uncharacterized protein n=1 Tax=Periplaneta americana TaxID=6978 RepID=A0ABQ8SK17_PERAM|nr:hypothetical protein ANN_23065 [Periplaneta americana]